jgi:hypothetical protein
MQDVLPSIKAFVSGEMSADAFRHHLYANADYETLLSNDPHLSPDNYVLGSAYRFLLELDFDNFADVLNAQGALADFLTRNKIEHVVTQKYHEFFDLIQKAQPEWLDVPDEFVQKTILPDAGERTGKALLAWLKTEFRNRFRYVGKPPRWIQAPDWPINENGPLIFLGQCSVKGYFHDEAAAYVFHDPIAGKYETVIQVY